MAQYRIRQRYGRYRIELSCGCGWVAMNDPVKPGTPMEFDEFGDAHEALSSNKIKPWSIIDEGEISG